MTRAGTDMIYAELYDLIVLILTRRGGWDGDPFRTSQRK